jgi:NAD(P)-dependent dehydrogenase (short-subunit alcohol dehydrogenase family)
VSAVLVTGTAGDIGGAIAEELAAAGRDLVLADQAQGTEALTRRAESCRGSGATLATVTFDVTDRTAATKAISDLGPLGGLVNNAGYQGVFASVDQYPLEDARRVVEVNVLGAITVLSIAARRIRVNAVSPRFVGPGRMWQTQIAEQAALRSRYADDPDAVARQMIETVPLGRYASAYEVPTVLAFLLSDAASYVNRVNIEVSGGSV